MQIEPFQYIENPAYVARDGDTGLTDADRAAGYMDVAATDQEEPVYIDVESSGAPNDEPDYLTLDDLESEAMDADGLNQDHAARVMKALLAKRRQKTESQIERLSDTIRSTFQAQCSEEQEQLITV